jgi:hypothetical protein
VRHPQTNGSTERLNQIVQNKFYNIAFRKKIYKSIEEIQVGLDIFIDNYNNERTNQGKHCQGRTPNLITSNYGWDSLQLLTADIKKFA